MAARDQPEYAFSFRRLLDMEAQAAEMRGEIEKLNKDLEDLGKKYKLVVDENLELETYLNKVGVRIGKFLTRRKSAVTYEDRCRVDVDNLHESDSGRNALPKKEPEVPSKNTSEPLSGPRTNAEVSPEPLAGCSKQLLAATALPVVQYGKENEVFQNVTLKDCLRRAMREFDFENLYEWKDNSILRSFLRGQDMVIESPEASGLAKIAVYSIHLLEKVDTSNSDCQALVLVPFRELAGKIENVLRALGKYMNVRIHSSVGGVKIRQEKLELSNGAHIIIGTPGRLHDMISRKFLRVDKVAYVVMDRGNKLVASDFVSTTKDIIDECRNVQQKMIFATSFNKDVIDFCKVNMKVTYSKIRVSIGYFRWDLIEQYFVFVDEDERRSDVIQAIRKRFSKLRTVVFCNSEKKVGSVQNLLQSDNERVLALHSMMKLEKRKEILHDFRYAVANTLITTEIPSRGCNDDEVLENVRLLINYELPASATNYLSRILHCGAKFLPGGIVINFVFRNSCNQLQLKKEFERRYRFEMKEFQYKV